MTAVIKTKSQRLDACRHAGRACRTAVRCLGLLGVTSFQNLDRSFLHPASPTNMPSVLSAFPLLDIEPFVRGELDTESNRPLLAALGVRDTPTGPERLLERIIALAVVDKPPLYELGKWYHRLDQMLSNLKGNQWIKLRGVMHEAFAQNEVRMVNIRLRKPAQSIEDSTNIKY